MSMRPPGGLLIVAGASILVLSLTSPAAAHPGRTDASGGHTCRTNCSRWGLSYGEYHFHGRSPKTKPAPEELSPATPAPTPAPEAPPKSEKSPKRAFGKHLPQAKTYNCPKDKPIKGNAQSGIYHLPGQKYYKQTKPEDCFTTEDEAKTAGYRRSKV